MISITLIVLAGICNAVMDSLQFRYINSVFTKLNDNFWDPRVSWNNKWKYTHIDNLYKKEEKFLGSSTVFVMFTDAWHLVKFIMLLLISASVVFYIPIWNWYIDISVMYCAFTITFELFYSKIFVNGK